MTSPDALSEVRERVRARYADAAATVLAGGTPSCGETCSGEEETGTGAALYSGTERDEVPGQAVTASLGCGNPVAVADLRFGETVLDLGSGGGLDVLLSARRKAAVLAESFRVLRPGGRLGVSDIVAEDHLTTADRMERGRQVGAIAGALSFADYRDGLARAGFTAITITPSHLVADGLHSAVVRAVRQ